MSFINTKPEDLFRGQIGAHDIWDVYRNRLTDKAIKDVTRITSKDMVYQYDEITEGKEIGNFILTMTRLGLNPEVDDNLGPNLSMPILLFNRPRRALDKLGEQVTYIRKLYITRFLGVAIDEDEPIINGVDHIASLINDLSDKNHIKGNLSRLSLIQLADGKRVIMSYLLFDDEGIKYLEDNKLDFPESECHRNYPNGGRMSLYEKSKAKDIIADKERLAKIVSSTLDIMATSVGSTLGPGGNAVLIEREGLPPLATKDGVTVAKSLGMDAAENNIIIEAAKEICVNTAKDAGDGTTTAIVLANAIVKYGQEFVKQNAKYNPQRIVNDLENVYEDVIVPYIKKESQPVDDEDKLKNVATISANGDSRIASVVVEAVLAAGDDGKVLIEEAQGNQMRVENIDGYIVTSGLKELGQLGPMFINDKTNQQVKMDNGFIFLYNGSINDLKVTAYIQDAIEGTEMYGSPLIIMAHDFADSVMDKLALNIKGGITLCPVKTPRSGLPNSRSIFLEDMAAYSGGTVIDPSNIDEMDETSFGQFTFAKSNMYETFITSVSDPNDIESRLIELKAIEDSCFSDMDKMHVRANIAKLTGGISTIYVGGVSDLQVRERKARVEDAVEAVRSAIAEGYIAGGCKVQIELAKLIEKHPSYTPSWDIMVQALKEPFRLLLENCGESFDEILPLIKGNTIFDANLHKLVNPYEAGIIEPAKVARVAIGNALSVASLLITLGGIVVTPRDSGLENQLAMSKQAFQDMMSSQGG